MEETQKTTGYIYALFDEKGCRYIGKSIDPVRRFKNSITPCRIKDKSDYKSNWIRKLLSEGKKPEQIIVEDNILLINLNDRERGWISFGRKMGWPLTNTHDGGNGVSPGHKVSEESKVKMSLAHLGHKPTEEAKKKRSLSQMGHTHTEETKKKMSLNNLGKKLSKDHKIKISQSNMGKVGSMKGKKHTEESKLKMSLARLGKKFPKKINYQPKI